MICSLTKFGIKYVLFSSTIFLDLFACIDAFPLASHCCHTELHTIDWGVAPSTGLWCYASPDVRDGPHYKGECGPICRDVSGKHFVLQCPSGLSRDCKKGCVYIDVSAKTASSILKQEGSKSCDYSGPEDFLEWARSQGAYVDSRIQLLGGPEFPHMMRGMYASAPIVAGELLVSVPPSMILKDNPLEDERLRSWCTLVPALRAELQLSKCSRFWPYLKIFQDSDVDVPNTWSHEDVSLLGDQPAVNWVRHSEAFNHRCKGDLSDPLLARALQIILSRAGPGYTGLVPVHDLFNHRGGTWQNVVGSTHGNNGRVEVFASKDIAAGSQLYHVYKPGAPWVFRDYGFVEQPPAVWWFDIAEQRFEWTIQDDEGHVSWHTFEGIPSIRYLRRFQREARALLVKLEQQQATLATSNSSRHQKLAAEYHSAYYTAVKLAIADASALLAHHEI